MKEKKPKTGQQKKAPYSKHIPLPFAYLLGSLLLCVGGVLFVLFPQEATNWTSRILGALTVALFLYLFVILCAKERRRGVRFVIYLVAYLLGMLAGGYLLFSPDTALAYLSLAVGVYALVDAGFKLRLAISACRYRALLWWALTVCAALAAVGGLVLLRFLPTDPIAVAVVMGLSMLAGGAQNFLAFFESAVAERRRAREAEENATTVVIDAAAARAQIPTAEAVDAKPSADAK